LYKQQHWLCSSSTSNNTSSKSNVSYSSSTSTGCMRQHPQSMQWCLQHQYHHQHQLYPQKQPKKAA
jgi:hypothetical protein